jgi:hypothetical protein
VICFSQIEVEEEEEEEEERKDRMRYIPIIWVQLQGSLQI